MINIVRWYLHNKSALLLKIFGFIVNIITFQRGQAGWICQLEIWIKLKSQTDDYSLPLHREVVGFGRYCIFAYVSALLSARRIYKKVNKDSIKQ